MSAAVAHLHLVASPLVGSRTWNRVAMALLDGGHRVFKSDWLVPVLMDGAGNPGSILGGDDLVVVGHSGAGVLLPNLVAERGPAHTRIVLVDAPLLPAAAEAPVPVVPPAFLDHLRTLADDGGLLPPWCDWFGPDVRAEVVPLLDVEDLPRVPLWYFDDTVTVPANWADFDGGYVLLSELYRPDADAAAARGWTVVERLGGHLDLVARPQVVADAILAAAL